MSTVELGTSLIETNQTLTAPPARARDPLSQEACNAMLSGEYDGVGWCRAKAKEHGLSLEAVRSRVRLVAHEIWGASDQNLVAAVAEKRAELESLVADARAREGHAVTKDGELHTWPEPDLKAALAGIELQLKLMGQLRGDRPPAGNGGAATPMDWPTDPAARVELCRSVLCEELRAAGREAEAAAVERDVVVGVTVVATP